MASNEGMKELVTVINKIHDAFASSSATDLNLQLPMIAVVGGQSAGKSSVLEAVAGREFLPRGTGIVTRCPIILQMIPSGDAEYVELGHQPRRKYTDLNEVRREIEMATEKAVAGQAISTTPISVRIYSPDVLQITLVDLPGLTKVPVGDQPDDIELVIRNMVLQYINPENTLILAVTPAAEDLANSDALQLARQVDPKGLRTIGVLTKLDLMDRGTNARTALQNHLYPLKRGYIGVLNRSQEDIQEGKDLSAAREDEEYFFRNHPAYSDLLDRVGTRTLQKLLNRQLEQHIKEKLPGIQSNLKQRMTDLQEELQVLGAFDDRRTNNNEILHMVMAKFNRRIQTSLKGFDETVEIKELQMGVVINETINVKIINGLLNEKQLLPTRKETMITLKNLVGLENYIAAPQQAFRRMVRHMAGRFREPMKAAVELVMGHTGEALRISVLKEIESFPRLMQDVLEMSMEKLRQNELECKKLLDIYVEAECAFINTHHPCMDQLDGLAWGKQSERDELTANNLIDPRIVLAPPAPNETKVTKLHQGYLELENDATFSKKRKSVWVVVNNVGLVVYKDNKEETETMQMKNNEIQMRVKTDMKKGVRQFITSRIDGRPISLGAGRVKALEFALDGKEGREAGDLWEAKFKEAGVDVRNSGSSTTFQEDEVSQNVPPPLSTSSSEDIDFSQKLSADKALNKDAQGFMEEIHKYMLIVKQTIQDITPKYIVRTIIDQLLTYIEERLEAELRDRGDLDQLMEPGGDEELRKRRKLNEYDATRKAVEMIGGIAWPSASKGL